MKDKPKCNCSKKGAVCGRELILIRRSKLVSDTNPGNKILCQMKPSLNDS